jgi:phosphate starvation-inducible PhoH-like protein
MLDIIEMHSIQFLNKLSTKIRYPVSVGARMKGKGKHRARDRDMWGIESDDEYLGKSPSSLPASFFHNDEILMQHRQIKARNPAQEYYLRLLQEVNPSIVVAAGPAGVAKTYLCNAVGVQKLLSGQVDKLIITRPAVSVDEEHGFLPGTLEEKMDPWLRPIYDVFYKFISPTHVANLLSKQQIEICPLAYMRGRTFDNAWICADEMQNSTPQQMLMLLTRIGKNSKLVITGDPAQHDRGYDKNGLIDLLQKMNSDPEKDDNKDLQTVFFTEEHVERHPVVKKVLKLYKTNSLPS